MVFRQKEGSLVQQLNLAICAGGLSWPVYIARDKDFAKSGLDVQITQVSDSVAQVSPRLVQGLIRAFLEGRDSVAGIVLEAFEHFPFENHRVRLPNNSHVEPGRLSG